MPKGYSITDDTAYHNIDESIVMPVPSFGVCKNARNCKNFKVVLGNGYCLKCYDRGLDRGRYEKS